MKIIPLLLLSFLSFAAIAQQKVLNYQTNNAQYHFNEAKLLHGEGKLDSAIISLQKALEYDGFDPNTLYYLAKCYRELADTDNTLFFEQRALASFERGHYLALSPYYLYHDYGVSNLTRLHYQVAYYCFNEALRYKATAAGVYNRGTCRLYLKDYKGACKDWKVARYNGIDYADKLINMYCKDCVDDSALYTLRDDSTPFLDFYPPDKDTITVALYFNYKWHLTNKRKDNYRIATWVISKQQFDGPFVDYNKTNKVAEGNYSEGKLNGLCSTYYNSGLPKSTGYFKGGEPDGIWNFNYWNGQPWISVDFSADGFEIIACFDQNGNATLKDGNGEWQYRGLSGYSSAYTISGTYSNYHRSGKWMMQNRANNVNYTEIYDVEGKLKKTILPETSDKNKTLALPSMKSAFIEPRFECVYQLTVQDEKATSAYEFINR